MPDGHLPKLEFPQGGGTLSDDVCVSCGREDLCPRCAYWEDRYARHHHQPVDWHPKRRRAPGRLRYAIWRLTRRRKEVP